MWLGISNGVNLPAEVVSDATAKYTHARAHWGVEIYNECHKGATSRLCCVCTKIVRVLQGLQVRVYTQEQEARRAKSNHVYSGNYQLWRQMQNPQDNVNIIVKRVRVDTIRGLSRVLTSKNNRRAIQLLGTSTSPWQASLFKQSGRQALVCYSCHGLSKTTYPTML